jgi:hypothetical protein
MRTATHIISVLCLSIIATAMLIAMYMLMDGVYFGVPIRLENGANVTTTAAVYFPGQEVQATLSYCRSSDLSGVIDWQIVDTYVRFYPASKMDLPTGCHTFTMDLGAVPSDVSSDTYHFTGVLTFKMNALTTVSYPLQSNNFTVEAD